MPVVPLFLLALFLYATLEDRAVSKVSKGSSTSSTTTITKGFDRRDLDPKWLPVCDLRVEEDVGGNNNGTTSRSGMFELKDTLGVCREIAVKYQGTSTEATDGWTTLQPTAQSNAAMQGSPHLQTKYSYMFIQHGFQVDDQSDWTLSFVGAELPNNNNNEYNIIFGPRNQCNCQIRYEYGNTLGLYATGSGNGWYDSGIPIPKTTTDLHVLTLSQEDGIVRAYQDNATISLGEQFESNPTKMSAEFAYIGSWFKGNYRSNIAIGRIVYMKGAIGPHNINDFIERMKLYSQ